MTPKQEAFCQAYVETGNASEAYRRAYSAEKMKPAVVNVKASELLATGKISVRVAELQQNALDHHELKVADIARMLIEDRKFAREMETPAAAVSASMGLAKLFGLLRDKVEHTGKDGGPIQTEQVEADADAFARRLLSGAAAGTAGSGAQETQH